MTLTLISRQALPPEYAASVLRSCFSRERGLHLCHPSLGDATSNHTRPWLSAVFTVVSQRRRSCRNLSHKSGFRHSEGSRPCNPRWD